MLAVARDYDWDCNNFELLATRGECSVLLRKLSDPNVLLYCFAFRRISDRRVDLSAVHLSSRRRSRISESVVVVLDAK